MWSTWYHIFLGTFWYFDDEQSVPKMLEKTCRSPLIIFNNNQLIGNNIDTAAIWLVTVDTRIKIQSINRRMLIKHSGLCKTNRLLMLYPTMRILGQAIHRWDQSHLKSEFHGFEYFIPGRWMKPFQPVDKMLRKTARWVQFAMVYPPQVANWTAGWCGYHHGSHSFQALPRCWGFAAVTREALLALAAAMDAAATTVTSAENSSWISTLSDRQSWIDDGINVSVKTTTDVQQ